MGRTGILPEIFLASPDFMSYLLNTLKLSIYGLIMGISDSDYPGTSSESDP